MKKLIAIIAIALGLSPAIASAQSSTPPFGSVRSGGNDASFLNYYNVVRTDVAGAPLDTVSIRPYHRRISVNLTVQDSCILNLSSLSGCYYTDQLDLYVTNPAQDGTLYLAGRWSVATGTTTLNLTAHKHYLIRFYFDGKNWVEYGRNANY